MRLASLAVAATTAAAALAAAPSAHAVLRMDQIQVIGSHNSYHRLATPAEQAKRTNGGTTPDLTLLYQHAPLRTQLTTQRVRQLELDLFADPNGGRYANPLIRRQTGGGPYAAAMRRPGAKVLHVQGLDYHSSCLSLVACLRSVRLWSRAHPRHVPVSILLELKDDDLGSYGTPLPWTAKRMDTIDREIRSVFTPGELITPDDVRGNHTSLDAAVRSGKGWPSLEDARGRVLFLMDNEGAARTRYLQGHPALAGRVVFTNSRPGRRDAAFIKENDVLAPGTKARIRSEVRRHYLVRTRADTDTLDARSGSTRRRDAALASGAQLVSTDYPVPGLAVGFTSSYVARLPDRVAARCNPVSAPDGCTRIASP